MTINVMEGYLNIVREKINKYMKLVFDNRYNKRIYDQYINAYIDIRYNNYSKAEDDFDDGLTLRKKILHTLQAVENNILENNPEQKELVDCMRIFFYYILYFDNVVYYKSLENKIDQIYKLRIKLLNKNNEDFKDNLLNLLNETDKKEKEFFDEFRGEKFKLKISEYSKKNVYRVNLETNIEFPEIYSQIAIKKAFNTGLVKEDKLYIEYYLIAIQIVNDLKKQNFKKQYIVEFADSILEKEKKIKGLLNILDSSCIQDKLSFKIRYKEYTKHKKEIEQLIKNGYHIAVILDDSFEVNSYEIQKLDMFKYVLVNESLEKYEQIKNYKEQIKNMIQI